MHFVFRSLPLLLPAVEDGIFNDSWRIRQSSVELLGDLLFKVFSCQPLSVSLGILNSEIACNSVCYLSRLLVLLEKLYWRVAVMMKVQVLRHRGGLSLRFLEGISVMKFSLHYIWFELMSASQCVR